MQNRIPDDFEKKCERPSASASEKDGRFDQGRGGSGFAVVHLICGTICSGKTFYAKRLAAAENAVILSCDELENDIFNKSLGEYYDVMSPRIKAFLLKKTVQLAQCGCHVILDWGFWSAEERKATDEFLKSAGLNVKWHYMSVSPKQRAENIRRRNKAVEDGLCDDYFVDSGLLAKSDRLFQPPEREEMDIWHEFTES